MLNTKWTVTEADDYNLVITTPAPCNIGLYRAHIQRNGCIHFEEWSSGEQQSYLHICDIDEHIAMLQELKLNALEHFGSDWE